MSKYDEEISSAAYKQIWDTVIQKLIDTYSSECLYINVSKNAYELIWDNYVEFRKHCREKYMSEPSELLDRHKVCACMICSIVKASVISESVPKDKKEKYYSVINEDLALTTGLSLLRAFVESSIRTNETDPSKQAFLLKKFEDGLKYPSAMHGNYRENFLAELHFTKVEGNYNILSLAHSLFLLETYTKLYN